MTIPHPQLKTRLFKILYLPLILGTHFGLLSLLFGYDWIRSFYQQYPIELLSSALVLSVFYTVSFRFFRVLLRYGNHRHMVWLYLVIAAGFSSILLTTFFSEKEIQYITASTTLFVGVIALIAYCDCRNTALWKNLQRALGVALFLVPLVFIYIYSGLAAYILFTGSIFLQGGNPLDHISVFYKKEQQINTQFYDLNFTTYHAIDDGYYIPARLTTAPGHISAIDNQNFLLIERRGNFYHLELKPGADGEDNLHLRKLAAVFPINWREFNAQEETRKVSKYDFRITDIYIETENGRQSLYVGHHFWNTRKKCVATNVTKLTGDLSILLGNNPAPKWHTLYEAAPCLPIGKNGKFFGNQSGGRIIGLDDRHILFSVGDYALAAGTGSPQDPDKSYGKIWKIHRHHGTAEIFSIGHRNPQGLYHAADGTIWETEHGPQSGDELNKIIPGRNYGWPYALYGVGYGSHVLASAKTQNSHHGYEQPIFAWTPSIAVSNLIEIEQDLFPLWQHNLLVSSLKARSLFRLQLHNDRVIYSEPIHIGERIRDITETPNGEIFMWTALQQLMRLRPAAFQSKENETLEQAGKRAFFRCLGCHSITKGAGHGVGPNLHDVYGGKIARHDQYPYSPALRSRTAQRWSGDHLDRFLEDPQAFASGSTMQMKTPDAAERRALIYYLKNL